MTAFRLIPYTRRHRRALLALVNDGRCKLHQHLDWHLLETWISHPGVPIFLAWDDANLKGAIAGSSPHAGTAWLRLVAIDEDEDTDLLLRPLWLILAAEYARQGVTRVGALLTQRWIAPHLEGLGFGFEQNIVTLSRYGSEPPPAPLVSLRVRHTDLRDVQTALDIDHDSFAPIWQMQALAMRQAVRDSVSFTLAESGGRAVGYQITTLHGNTAHLARLGVLSGIQGRGVGGLLLGEMLDDLHRRGVSAFTVNTQAHNERSIRLYQRYGFAFNHNDMPCWFAAP